MYIAISYHTLTLSKKFGQFFFREDAFFETLGFVSFFTTSIIFFYAYQKIRRLALSNQVFYFKKFVILGLGILFFFAAGEEISWGQRIFDIQTPNFFAENNSQNEINIHNLDWFGIYLPSDFFFDLFWLIFCVVLPFLSLNHYFKVKLSKFLPIPAWGVGLLFLFNYIYAKIAKLLYIQVFEYRFGPLPFSQAVQEIKESNYALIFVFIAISSVLFLFEEQKQSLQ